MRRSVVITKAATPTAVDPGAPELAGVSAALSAGSVAVNGAAWNLPATISVQQDGVVWLRQYVLNAGAHTISVSGLPAGVTYNAVSESLEGAATGTSSGTATFTLTLGATAVVDTATVALYDPAVWPPSLGTQIASPYSLEILNLKPAGTGSPVMPATHRHFRAYPGIEYNIRPAVRGGTYPYLFELENAPAGMTINSRTGEISWPNPQADSGTITLRVTDYALNQATTTWVITVSTAGFVFLDGSYVGTSTGSITQPFKTIDEVLSASGAATDICYVRAGVYSYPAGTGQVWLTGKAHTWLAYPGESVTISSGGRYFRTDNQGIYLDGISLGGFAGYGLVLFGGHHYQVVRRCAFSDINNTSSVNENQGFIYATGGASGFGLAILDNSFDQFVGAQAIGSLYGCDDSLIEGNSTTNGGVAGGHGFCTPVGYKSACNRPTLRGNLFEMPANATSFEFYNPSASDPELDCSYNRILRGGSSMIGASVFYPSPTHFYRNTLQNTQIRLLRNLNSGPHYADSNVLVNSEIVEINGSGALTLTNNLTATLAEGAIDAEGRLTAGYQAHLNDKGWEVSY